VLRKILGLKRDEVKGQFRILNNKELHDLYRSPSIVKAVKSRNFPQA